MAHESPQHELAAAIITKWAATAACSGYFSTLSRDEAKREDGEPLPTIPYAAFSLASTREFASTENEYWRHVVEFEAFDRTETLGATALSRIKGIFNESPIVLPLGNGHSLLGCQVNDESNVQDDKAIWRATLSVTIKTSCPI